MPRTAPICVHHLTARGGLGGEGRQDRRTLARRSVGRDHSPGNKERGVAQRVVGERVVVEGGCVW